MTNILKECPFAYCGPMVSTSVKCRMSIVDDILVCGSAGENHETRMKGLLHNARETDIIFNQDKCKFKFSEVAYLTSMIQKKYYKCLGSHA